jgi:hypothetical protein
VFSGGAGSTTYPYPVIASIVANSISTLELTRLGSYLDGDRVNYSEDLLERVWKGAQGGKHPTALLTMNVAGLKTDCFPVLFHLRAVRSFADEVTRSLTAEEETAVREEVETCLRDSRINDDGIVADLGIGARPVTREENRDGARAAGEAPRLALGAPRGRCRSALEARRRRGADAADRGARRPGAARDRCPCAGARERSGGWLPGAIQFYAGVQKTLEANRTAVLERGRLARTELGSTRTAPGSMCCSSA